MYVHICVVNILNLHGKKYFVSKNKLKIVFIVNKEGHNFTFFGQQNKLSSMSVVLICLSEAIE